MFDFLKTLPQYIVPQHLFSRLMGWLAHSKHPGGLKNWAIKKFIHHYKVNLSEAIEQDYKKYLSFNDFFTRKLLPHVRSVDTNPQAIVSPADGTISQIGKIDQEKLLQAKGYYYKLTELWGGNSEEVLVFENGAFATIYLSPKDYHRVHMPYTGRFLKKIHVPGRLFSVNNCTTHTVPRLFARNERMITFFQTDRGKMAVIFVGAMIVGHIVITAQENHLLEKGDELGYFQLGSTVIILFEAPQILWQKELYPNVPVKMGQTIGQGLQPLSLSCL